MMSHADLAIERYFEGRLVGSEERDALFGHLDRCAACRIRFDQIALLHRALAPTDRETPVPATELSLIGRAVVARAAHEETRRKGTLATLAKFAVAMVPVSAALALLLVLEQGVPRDHPDQNHPDQNPRAQPQDEFASKGGGATTSRSSTSQAVVEVLCFDELGEISAHLKQDGSCPAPGFVKIIYASPTSTPHLSLAITDGKEVRFFIQLDAPKPRSVVPDHVALQLGEALHVIAVSGKERMDREHAVVFPSVLTVRGVAK